MSRRLARRGFVVVLFGLATLAAADTLVLRDGRRVEGRLVEVRGGTVEFEERGRSRTYDRDDVRRIELDDSWRSSEDRGGAAGMRERTVAVAAASAWSDTGIDVRRGQEIRFKASGKIRWGADRSDGPGGEGGRHYNANRPLPDRPGAALIGRIGDGQDVFFVGDDDAPMRAREDGRLYLGINDDYLPDNSGSFRVTVYY